MGMIRGIIVSLMVLLLFSSNSYSSWLATEEVVTGAWGSNPGQFFFGSGDTVDSFPHDFGVDSEGRIFISDESNVRIQVFTKSGSLNRIIAAPADINKSLGWPYNIYLRPDGALIASYEGPQKFFFDNSGNLIKKVDVYGPAYSVSQGFVFYVSTKEYPLYSPIGQLLQTYTERPLELGRVIEKSLGGGTYKITVTYPDKEFGIMRGKAALTYSYARDKIGNLYGIGNTQVVRYNDCGKEIAKVVMPEAQYQPITLPSGWPENAEPPRRPVLEEYGSPVLAPNGDVYTWKRTPDKYSIVKWTWQDDPNPPANLPDPPSDLKVTVSVTGIKLWWTISPQDPGCVTGYEIVRSETAGGPYTALTSPVKETVKYEDTTAEVGKTYYYKIRAAGGTGYSDYSNEAMGKR